VSYVIARLQIIWDFVHWEIIFSFGNRRLPWRSRKKSRAFHRKYGIYKAMYCNRFRILQRKDRTKFGQVLYLHYTYTSLMEGIMQWKFHERIVCIFTRHEYNAQVISEGILYDLPINFRDLVWRTPIVHIVPGISQNLPKLRMTSVSELCGQRCICNLCTV
jgi:hypothetical protein